MTVLGYGLKLAFIPGVVLGEAVQERSRTPTGIPRSGPPTASAGRSGQDGGVVPRRQRRRTGGWA